MLGRFRLWRDKLTKATRWEAESQDILQAGELRRSAVQAEGLGATVAWLEALLFRHDPVGINFEENTDEYRSEAESIALRRSEVQSADDALRVVHEEFVRWFDLPSAGPTARYRAIASEVWDHWRPPGETDRAASH